MLIASMLLTLIAPVDPIRLVPIGRYETGWFGQSAAEIVAYDRTSKRAFLVNGAEGIEIVDVSDPTAPRRVRVVRQFGVNSVATSGDLVAFCWQPKARSAIGSVSFIDTNGRRLRTIPVGHGPDMIAFTPDGTKLVVANEGEPDDDAGIDPDGSISIIDLESGVAHATAVEIDFRSFESHRERLISEGAHLSADATLAQQFEPEYIAISPDGRSAYVTLQESNAIAMIDLATSRVAAVVGLPLKDFLVSGLDANDRDGRIDIEPWPVFGLRQPDSIACWESNRTRYLATADEGESRKGPTGSEAIRIGASRGDLADAAVGRLEVSRLDLDRDGRLVAFGGRGITIWRAEPDGRLTLMSDSGDTIERTVADRMPCAFNADNVLSPSRDDRSARKGPEPEGIAVAEIGARRYAFVTLERPGGVIAYDVTDPRAPFVATYVNPRDPTIDLGIDDDHDGRPDRADLAGDLGPEGILVIPAVDSPIGTPLVLVCNEVSGTLTIYRIDAHD